MKLGDVKLACGTPIGELTDYRVYSAKYESPQVVYLCFEKRFLSNNQAAWFVRESSGTLWDCSKDLFSSESHAWEAIARRKEFEASQIRAKITQA